MQIQISWLLHCLQRLGISRFSRTRVNTDIRKCLSRYPLYLSSCGVCFIPFRVDLFSEEAKVILKVAFCQCFTCESDFSTHHFSVRLTDFIFASPRTNSKLEILKRKQCCGHNFAVYLIYLRHSELGDS